MDWPEGWTRFATPNLVEFYFKGVILWNKNSSEVESEYIWITNKRTPTNVVIYFSLVMSTKPNSTNLKAPKCLIKVCLHFHITPSSTNSFMLLLLPQVQSQHQLHLSAFTIPTNKPHVLVRENSTLPFSSHPFSGPSSPMNSYWLKN
jgi:hypothetical protein